MKSHVLDSVSLITIKFPFSLIDSNQLELPTEDHGMDNRVKKNSSTSLYVLMAVVKENIYVCNSSLEFLLPHLHYKLEQGMSRRC